MAFRLEQLALVVQEQGQPQLDAQVWVVVVVVKCFHHLALHFLSILVCVNFSWQMDMCLELVRLRQEKVVEMVLVQLHSHQWPLVVVVQQQQPCGLVTSSWHHQEEEWVGVAVGVVWG